jgi:hypothetical protein
MARPLSFDFAPRLAGRGEVEESGTWTPPLHVSMKRDCPPGRSGLGFALPRHLARKSCANQS